VVTHEVILHIYILMVPSDLYIYRNIPDQKGSDIWHTIETLGCDTCISSLIFALHVWFNNNRTPFKIYKKQNDKVFTNTRYEIWVIVMWNFSH